MIFNIGYGMWNEVFEFYDIDLPGNSEGRSIMKSGKNTRCSYIDIVLGVNKDNNDESRTKEKRMLHVKFEHVHGGMYRWLHFSWFRDFSRVLLKEKSYKALQKYPIETSSCRMEIVPVRTEIAKEATSRRRRTLSYEKSTNVRKKNPTNAIIYPKNAAAEHVCIVNMHTRFSLNKCNKMKNPTARTFKVLHMM
ncbi:hypothetical protein ABKN59_011520 [Abortiporus biennis]